MVNNPLYVDVHEPVRIASGLVKLGIPVKREQLKLGDYQWGEYIIERKSVQDLLGSVYSGRLYNQLYDLMKLEDRKVALFVIGEIPPVARWTRTARGRTYQQMLTKEERNKIEDRVIPNLALAFTSFHIPVFQCTNERQFIKYLSAMYYKCNRTTKSLKPVKRKSQTIPEIKSDMLCCLSNIGRVTSDKLSENFTIKQLVNMEMKDMLKIPGIGKKTAEAMYKIFNE